MRVMVIVKATGDSEKGFTRTPEAMAMMEAMGRLGRRLEPVGRDRARSRSGRFTSHPTGREPPRSGGSDPEGGLQRSVLNQSRVVDLPSRTAASP